MFLRQIWRGCEAALAHIALQKALRPLLGIALVVLLTACGAGVGPSNQLVERAIALQLDQTQQELRQQLRLGSEPAQIQIRHLSIAQQTPLTIDNLQAFQVRGSYDFTLKLPKRQITRQQNPFEVYLQRQREGKTWRLAYLEVDEENQPVWVTQALQ